MHVLALTTNEDAPFFTQSVASLAERGVSTTVAPVPGDPTGADGRSPLDYARYVRNVRRSLDRTVDLVHAHYGLTAPFALAQRRVPVVLSLWGSDLLGSVGPLSRFASRFCDEVIVMSPEMARAIDLDPHVIPDGIDLERFHPIDYERAGREVGWTEPGYDVLFPYGPHRTVKNHPRAERIIKHVSERFDVPVRLRTVSGVSHDRIPLYMNAADALLLTSHSEGSPNAIKEALACELPVVSTDVGDVRERTRGVEPTVIADDDRALVDGLEAVLRAETRSNGRNAIEPLRLERTTDATVAVYHRALTAGSTKDPIVIGAPSAKAPVDPPVSQ